MPGCVGRGAGPVMKHDIVEQLEQRFGRLHSRQRLGIEDDHEARAGGRGIGSLRPKRWYLSPPIIRSALKLSGLYWRARRNAARIQIRRHDIALPRLPAGFDGFTILQISDLHIDMNQQAMRRLAELLPDLRYDLCVLTGDYRGKTYGPFEATIEGMARLRKHLVGPIYGVLGNHDTLRMAPALEEMGIRMLVNEAEPLLRDGQRLHLAGIDDAHYYRVRQHRKGGRANSRRRMLDPAVAHARDLSPGGARRFRPAAVRTYTWRPDLSARRHSDHPQFGAAAAHGVGAMALSRYGRLYLGRRRLVHRRGPDQLPARNHPAPFAPGLSSHADFDQAEPPLIRHGRAYPASHGPAGPARGRRSVQARG